MEVDAFEDCWRTNCLAGFIVGREAARCMQSLHRGWIVFVGSTSGLIGREDHLNLAIGKFGLRALSQVMARELWKEGLHVSHVVIDADIREPGVEFSSAQSDPDAIAEVILSIHKQPRSAWASEVDVRPWNEEFWKHCRSTGISIRSAGSPAADCLATILGYPYAITTSQRMVRSRGSAI